MNTDILKESDEHLKELKEFLDSQPKPTKSVDERLDELEKKLGLDRQS